MTSIVKEAMTRGALPVMPEAFNGHPIVSVTSELSIEAANSRIVVVFKPSREGVGHGCRPGARVWLREKTKDLMTTLVHSSKDLCIGKIKSIAAAASGETVRIEIMPETCYLESMPPTTTVIAPEGIAPSDGMSSYVVKTFKGEEYTAFKPGEVAYLNKDGTVTNKIPTAPGSHIGFVREVNGDGTVDVVIQGSTSIAAGPFDPPRKLSPDGSNGLDWHTPGDPPYHPNARTEIPPPPPPIDPDAFVGFMQRHDAADAKLRERHEEAREAAKQAERDSMVMGSIDEIRKRLSE